jgi:DNA-binding transcriptional ArsR family regulator
VRALTPILAAYSEPRERIYRALLAAQGREWRVGQLAAQVPDVSVEAVRTTLYLLLGDHLVELVPCRRSLTLRLNEFGHTTIERITSGWRRPGETGGVVS